MTYKENITAILECYFTGFKEEIIDSACNRILEQEPCEDCISRQAVLDIVDSYSESQSNVQDVTQDIISDIMALPPVNPQPKTGHWIAEDIHNCHTNFKCSECDYIHSFMHLYGEPTADYTYCPNCGAKMEVENG